MNTGVISPSHVQTAQKTAADPIPTIQPTLRLKKGHLTRISCTVSLCIARTVPSFSSSTIDVSLNELKRPLVLTYLDDPSSRNRTLVRTPAGMVSIRFQSENLSSCTSSLDAVATGTSKSITRTPTKRRAYCMNRHRKVCGTRSRGASTCPWSARSAGLKRRRVAVRSSNSRFDHRSSRRQRRVTVIARNPAAAGNRDSLHFTQRLHQLAQ